jgi:hypothetical protein
MGEVIRFTPKPKRSRLVHGWPGADKGEIVRFIPKSERERARLIREARAIYDSIFPPADPRGHMVSAANRSDGILLS